MEQKLIHPWKVYLWDTHGVVWGAAPVVTRDGLKEIYRENCQYDVTDKKNKWRAEQQVKKQLKNTLNAINWYGKKILDRQGNIDPAKFQEAEIAAAVTSSGIHIDINDAKPIKKWNTVKITEAEAKAYNFL